MPFHTFGYSGTTTSTVAEINAISDSVLYQQNSHVVPSVDMYLYSAAAFSPTARTARFASPSMRAVCNNQIRPLMASGIPTVVPQLQTYFDSPVRLRAREEVIVQGSSTSSE